MPECSYLVVNYVQSAFGTSSVPLGVVLECPGTYIGCRLRGSRVLSSATRYRPAHAQAGCR